jgi:thioesterase superfamily protein 4
MTETRKPLSFQEPPSEVKSQFSSPKWAADIFNDPTYQACTNESRVLKPTNADSFCSKTLATSDTIAACQLFYKGPQPPNQFCEIIGLFKLGSGVNGHIDTCHGGFVSFLLDEIIGMAAEGGRPRDKATMTAYLKVDYKKPVRTPGTVLCRAWLEKTEGRKMWGRGTVEDGDGGIMAVGEALFIVVERVKAKEKL